MRKRFAAVFLALLLLLPLSGGARAAQVEAYSDPAQLDNAGVVTLYFNIANDSVYAMERVTLTGHGINHTEQSPIPVGSSRTLSFPKFGVSKDMIGQVLSFELNWYENGVKQTRPVTVTVQKGKLVSLSATRKTDKKQVPPGEVITLTYTLKNTGTVTLKSIKIMDREINRNPILENYTLQPGEEHTVTYQYKMRDETVVSAPVITYLPEGSAQQETVNIKETTLGMVNSQLEVEVNQDDPTPDGVKFTLYITNNGNQSIRNITVKDDAGKALNSEPFSLAVGEKKVLTHTVPSNETRYVVFAINGIDGTGETFEDKTSSFLVRKYIDPALLGIKMVATVVEPLSASGAIKISFDIENTGSLDMSNVVITESVAGEIAALGDIAAGAKQTVEKVVQVGEPRELVFTLTSEDPSGAPHNSFVKLNAEYPGDILNASPTPPVIEDPNMPSMGAIGSTLSTTLTTSFIILASLMVIAGAALITLHVLEKKQRAVLAHQRALRERHMAQQGAGAPSMPPGGYFPQSPASKSRAQRPGSRISGQGSGRREGREKSDT